MSIPEIEENYKYPWGKNSLSRCAECSESVRPQKVTRVLAEQFAKMQKDQDAFTELEEFFRAENPISHEEIRDQIGNWNKKHYSKLYADEFFQKRLNEFLQKKVFKNFHYLFFNTHSAPPNPSKTLFCWYFSLMSPPTHPLTLYHRPWFRPGT